MIESVVSFPFRMSLCCPAPLPTTKLGVTEKELIIITEKRGKEISVSLCLDLDVQRHTTGRVWAERKVAFLSECQLASWRIAEII